MVAFVQGPNAIANTQQQSQVQFIQELQVVGAALSARNQLVQAFENRDFSEITLQTLNETVLGLENELRARQVSDLADELKIKWENSYFNVLGGLSTTDLGDHDALFPWMEDFFLKLEDRLGTAGVNSLPYVADIRTLNFALPVVFQPQGKWQASVTGDLRIEYRKHFIPFANIVTYYSSYFGCTYYVKSQGMSSQMNKLCKMAADKLKFVMGRYIAPQISDFIFKAANRSYSVPQSSLVYRTAEQLRNDL